MSVEHRPFGTRAPDAPAVSVVIPTRRRPRLLHRSVCAVLAQCTEHAYEVIVVNDDTGPLACELPTDARLRVLSSGARGVSRARNVGIADARAPIVAFTDDDTVAAPSWIEAIVDAFTSPDVVSAEGPVVHGAYDPLYERVPQADPPGAWCGANVAYRIDALRRVGGFDERFLPGGAEDVDLGLRIAQLGQIAFAGDMVVEHPPRPMGLLEHVRRGILVQNDWLLHTKHPTLTSHRLPIRWGPVVTRIRRSLRAVTDPAVIRESHRRRLRAIALAVGMTWVSALTALHRWKAFRAASGASLHGPRRDHGHQAGSA